MTEEHRGENVPDIVFAPVGAGMATARGWRRWVWVAEQRYGRRKLAKRRTATSDNIAQLHTQREQSRAEQPMTITTATARRLSARAWETPTPDVASRREPSQGLPARRPIYAAGFCVSRSSAFSLPA